MSIWVMPLSCGGALVYHVRSGRGTIDELLFVSGDFVVAKTGHPCEQVVSIGEDEFCHTVKVDLVAFDIEGVPTLDVVALVDRRHECLTQYQRYVVGLVVIGELARRQTRPALQESEYLDHQHSQTSTRSLRFPSSTLTTSLFIP